MRRALLLGAGLGIANTAVLLLLSWLFRPPTTFGFYSYSPMPQRYSDYLGVRGRQLNGWTALALVAAVLVVVNMALVAAYLAAQRIRRRRRAPAPSPGVA